MAAMSTALLSHLSAGDHPRRGAPRCSDRAGCWSTRSCRASASRRRWLTAATPTRGRRARRPNTKAFFLETPSNPGLDIVDIAAVADIGHDAGGAGRRRQRLRLAGAAAAVRPRGRRRRAFGDQAHGRAGAGPRRRGPRHGARGSPTPISRWRATPGRCSARSTRGSCSSPWRRSTSAFAARTTTPLAVADRARTSRAAAALSRPAEPSAARPRDAPDERWRDDHRAVRRGSGSGARGPRCAGADRPSRTTLATRAR